MKKFLFRFLVLTTTFTLAGFSTQAAIIATDDFESYTAGTNLAGGTGGTGWSATGWVTTLGSSGATVTVEANGGSNAAEFTTGTTDSNLPNFAYRQLAAPYTGDLVYVSFTLELGQTPAADFFTLWVDDTTSTGNNHGDSLNTGLLNTTNGLFARPNSTPIINGPSAASDTTYQLVVEYSKSVSGAAQPFNTVSFWVNPTNSDLGTPIGTASFSTNSSITTIGFRGALNESGNTYWVDNVTLATAWNDVVPVPEPSTSVLLAGALTVAVTLRRRRRS